MNYPWNKPILLSLLSRKGQLPHALLFRGPQGIGKLGLAEALAMALLCERPEQQGEACGACVACTWAGQGSHPDWHRLEPASLAESDDAERAGDRKEKASEQIPVERVRGVANFIQMSSHRGGAKVVLIHPAEALNIHAANALLKGLEEPPPRTYFLLVAHRWQQLLPTLKSRCQQIGLAIPPTDLAQTWLKEQGVRDPALGLAQAGGAPLQATRFDEDYWAQRDAFLKTLGGRRFDALAAAERLRDTAPGVAVEWLQKWSYDLALCLATGKLRYNPDYDGAIRAAAASIGLLEATRFLRRVVRLQRIVAHPLNSRLFLEDLLLAYAALLRGRPAAGAA